MKMTFEERPYAGKNFRPRPEIYIDEQSRTLIVATPWGPRESARKTIASINDFLSLAREDREATSPFPRLTCLSSLANNLRAATFLANEALFREDNRTEYRAGVELFAAAIDDEELVWVQAGSPQILLSRGDRSPLPLGSNLDLAFDLSGEGTKHKLLPPLPSQLLGIEMSLNLNINSFRVRGGDKIILLSHSHLPSSIFSMSGEKADIENLSRSVADSYPDLAFWLGILKIENQNTDDDTDDFITGDT